MTRDFMNTPPFVVNPRHPNGKIVLHRGDQKKILKRCKNNTICDAPPPYTLCGSPVTHTVICQQQTRQPSNKDVGNAPSLWLAGGSWGRWSIGRFRRLRFIASAVHSHCQTL